VVLVGVRSVLFGQESGSIPNSAQPVDRLKAIASNAQTHLFVCVAIGRISRKEANECALGNRFREVQRGKRPR
jgi:hypothetical protein